MAQRIDHDAVLRLRSEGLTTTQIAARPGCSPSGVQGALHKLATPRRQSGPAPTLCEAKVVQMWHDGARLQEIADTFGVSTTTIYAYAKRLNLPKRPRAERASYEPSLEEISRLKAELRKKHFAERRAEKDDYHREVMA